MIAWVSPVRMVRSTPLRIGVVPGVGLDRDVQVADLEDRHVRLPYFTILVTVGSMSTSSPSIVDDVDGDRLVGGEVEGLAGAQRERRAVRPALQRVALDEALGQRDVAVRAGVADRVDLAARSRGRRRSATPSISTRSGGVLLELARARRRRSARHCAAPPIGSSSASMAAMQLGLEGGDADLLHDLAEEADARRGGAPRPR